MFAVILEVDNFKSYYHCRCAALHSKCKGAALMALLAVCNDTSLLQKFQVKCHSNGSQHCEKYLHIYMPTLQIF